MPAVSIIIPSYNRMAILPKAIDSVLAQGFTDWELLVVDDGSTDETERVVSEYATRHPAIRYLRQENKKQAAARNHGIREARGKYLAFLDSDDEWLPGKLERQVALLDGDAELGMVYGNQLVQTPPDLRWHLRYPPGTLPSGNIFPALLRREFYCSLQTVLVRRSVVEEVGPLDEAFTSSLEDWEFTLRISRRCKAVATDDPVCLRRVNTAYPRHYALMRVQHHCAILTKTLSDGTVPCGEVRQLWRQAFYNGGVALLQSGYYVRSAACFIRATLRGHRLGLPGLVLALAGPVGAALYRKLRTPTVAPSDAGVPG